MSRLKYLLFLIALFFAFSLIPKNFTQPIKSASWGISQPVLFTFERLTRGISRVFGFPHILKENKTLKVQVDELKARVSDAKALEAENERLRRLLELKERSPLYTKLTAAVVVGRNPSSWRDTLILNKGERDGVHKGMAVMSRDGLLGVISEADGRSSKVKLITHPRFKVAALTQRSRHTGVVYGTPEGSCRMKYIAMDADVEIGDPVETASFSENVPKGILIGRIDGLWKRPGQLYRVASLELAADLDRIEEVMIVRE